VTSSWFLIPQVVWCSVQNTKHNISYHNYSTYFLFKNRAHAKSSEFDLRSSYITQLPPRSSRSIRFIIARCRVCS